MKITYIAVRGIPLSDGIAQYTDELAYNLTKRGHEVTVYTSKRYGNKTGDYKGRYFIRTVPSIKGSAFEKMSLIFFASVAQMFKKYDIVHFHGNGLFTFTASLFGKKVILQKHGIEHERAKWGKFAKAVLLWTEKHSYKKGDALTVVSKALQNYYLERYNKQTVYIPTAVNLPDLSELNDEILRNLKLCKDGYYLFMARIVQEKGVHYLIQAFKKANTAKKLVIAGTIDKSNPYHCELMKMAEDDERIFFLGNISGEIKDTVIKGAYAFCQPSETEGLSVALLEAMSYQKCCIVSSIPMNTEAVEDTGIIFENMNIEDLSEKILFAERNPDFVSDQGKRARKRVEQNYTWQIVTDQMEELYKEVLK